MKQVMLLLFISIITSTAFTQGNSHGKGKDKSGDNPSSNKNSEKNNNDAKDRSTHEIKIWEGTYVNAANGPKPAKNQPANVRVAFQRDYPNATGVYWSKYRGDWTANFRNGIWMSTAVYHANGERRDTRTVINKENIPQKIFDIITKKPDTQMDNVIKIEVPKAIKDIFRVKSIINGKPQYLYYNSDGLTVQYNY